jgi:hypothetical protein
MSDTKRGLYGKYRVQRLGGTPGKHDDCEYFVLDLMHDIHARAALAAYAESCRREFPVLAADLDGMVNRTVSMVYPPFAWTNVAALAETPEETR